MGFLSEVVLIIMNDDQNDWTSFTGKGKKRTPLNNENGCLLFFTFGRLLQVVSADL